MKKHSYFKDISKLRRLMFYNRYIIYKSFGHHVIRKYPEIVIFVCLYEFFFLFKKMLLLKPYLNRYW